MSDFKVIIVGGSVAGLTLANILERYAVDYIVLEKHSEIAPQLGASLGLLPHGERILDQLGIFSRVEAISKPMEKVQFHGPDGLPLIAPLPFGMMVEELLGYSFRFLDRQQLLQVLFDSIGDKSKIRTSSEVFKIDALDGHVQVNLKDGTSVKGDIVVGADGVHSRIRDEMWRIAKIDIPGYNSTRLSKSIACAYKCVFGIAKRPPGITSHTSFKCFHAGRSYLCASGPDDKMYFFGFFKNPKVSIYRDIPRYSVSETQSLVAEYANDPLFHGVTFGELCDRHTSMVLVPLEEYVLEKCFYKRATLIGDSFHKMNPLTGQGGNSAIESAAMLADLLKGALERNPKPDDDTIRHVFTTFQESRRPRTTNLMETTQQVQQMEVLDNAFLEFMQLTVMSQMGHEHFAPALAASSTPGLSLKYMPQTYRKGIVSPNEEVQAKPHARSSGATGPWAALMLAIAALGSTSTGLMTSNGSGPNQSSALGAYLATSSLAIQGVWIVESYRPGLFFTVLFSSVPYILASFACGWHVILPLYFALHIYLSQKEDFYYPSPRAINIWVAKSLPIGILVAYLATFIQSSISPGDGGLLLLSINISLPTILFFGKRLFPCSSAGKSIFLLLFANMDLKHLSRLFTTIFLFSSAAHVHFLVNILNQSASVSLGPGIVLTRELVQLGCLTLAIIAWCSFVVWDMRRVNLTRASPILAFFGATVGSILLGPAAVLAALWRWREPVLERGRQKPSHGSIGK